MTACKQPFDVVGGRSVFLEFDGERLDPVLRVQDTEITDLDCIDVHVV